MEQQQLIQTLITHLAEFISERAVYTFLVVKLVLFIFKMIEAMRTHRQLHALSNVVFEQVTANTLSNWERYAYGCWKPYCKGYLRNLLSYCRDNMNKK